MELDISKRHKSRLRQKAVKRQCNEIAFSSVISDHKSQQIASHNVSSDSTHSHTSATDIPSHSKSNLVESQVISFTGQADDSDSAVTNKTSKPYNPLIDTSISYVEHVCDNTGVSCNPSINTFHEHSFNDTSSPENVFKSMLEMQQEIHCSESESDSSCASSIDSCEHFDDLRDWCIKHKITHSAINDLLNILPKQWNLPKDARTLLKTPRETKIKKLENGDYYHIGLLEEIEHTLNVNNVESDSIHIDINIDGLPLYKSSGQQLWPILGRFYEISKKPFVIGVFCGAGKPSSLDQYLADTVADLKKLTTTGVEHNGKSFKFKIRSFICDAPARAYLKCITGHTGYHSCEKCTIKGEWVTDRVSFLTDNDAQLRTDQSFLDKIDEKHHTKCLTSPLTNLPIGLVSNFPLDYMHLACLGIMKKLLFAWVRGTTTKLVKLHPKDIEKISLLHVDLGLNVPYEFNRKPRSLKELNRWKATEFRLFLLYTGPVVLKPVLPDAVYDNFMLLHVAIFILIQPCDISSSYYTFAERTLQAFVNHSIKLYGRKFISYNVHALIHLVNDVKMYGPLDSFSCFPFENYLGYLKKILRSPSKPLQQLARRYSEFQRSKESPIISRKFQHKHNSGPLLGLCEAEQFTSLHLPKFKLSLSIGDNCCLLNNGSVVIIKNIIKTTSQEKLIYVSFKKLEEFYSYPCSSRKFGVQVVSELSSELECASVKDIKCKCMVLKYSSSYVCYPLYSCS